MTTRVDLPPVVSVDGQRPSVKPSVLSCRLAVALAVVTTVACALTFFLPDVLVGPDVMNGSARGTAIVVLLVTVPVLVVGLARTDRGSAFGLLLVLGSVAHVLYQSVLFLFATPFNDLFLLYLAMFALALWTAIALVASVDLRAVRARIHAGVPARPIAIFVWAVVVLNAIAWLGTIVPWLLEDGFPVFLGEAGLTTNPIHVQDLAFWLPLMALGAWWLWRGRDRGYVLIGAMLTMWLLESVTVAVDQWMGSSADPASDVATMAGAWLFVGMALATVVPWVAFYRRVER
ncbi:MAG TPA: hypothetical protein VF235_01900 [Actinomycetota bacterium]